MKRFFLATAATLLCASPALSQTLFLDDATVIAPNGVSQTQDLILTDGRITDMGSALTAPDGVETMTGVWVTPGLVASISTLGIVDVGAESSTNDISANTELASVALQAVDSFNPRNVHIGNARRRGVMYAAVASNPTGDTIFGGVGMIAGTDGSVEDEAAFVHIALGQSGASRAGGSRSAAIAQLRGAFADVRRSYLTQDEGDVLRRRDAQALRPVLAGRMPLIISASRASDLMRIVDLKADFTNLDIIVIGAEEAYLVADDLAVAGIKVVVDPQENLPDNFDSVNASFENVLTLEASGVDYAIAGLSSLGVVKAGNLTQHAGNAVGHGLSREAAFTAIMETPARWFGIGLGSMNAGSSASLVVWDGDPLEITSAPVAMYKDGQTVSLESRMTALRDRYNPSSTDDRPHKYR